MSVLFTGSTAVKFVNALNKPPLRLSLSYQRLSTFYLYRISNPTMEEIGATNPEYQPLRVLWRRSCAHARKTIPLAPIHSFTKQIVPSMYQESLSWNRWTSITQSPYKLPPSIKNILGARRFFLHRTLLSWACGDLRELA